MNINTKYGFDTPIYIITKYNSNRFYIEFYIEDCTAYIEKITLTNTSNKPLYFVRFKHYKVEVSEDMIDNIENGYFFSSSYIAEKAVKVANKELENNLLFQ